MTDINNDATDTDPLVLAKDSPRAADQESSGGSYFSGRHLSKEAKESRTSTFWYTFANILKSMIGITLLVIP